MLQFEFEFTQFEFELSFKDEEATSEKRSQREKMQPLREMSEKKCNLKESEERREKNLSQKRKCERVCNLQRERRRATSEKKRVLILEKKKMQS